MALTLLSPSDSTTKYTSTDIPVHFYRELVRTTEGCKLLQQKGHVRALSDYVKEHKLEQYDMSILKKLKGCLWALGNLGSLSMGLKFLEETDIIKSIVEIAYKSEVWSLKG